MSDAKVNPYFTVVERNLPRVLSLINRDRIGGSLGIADRRYWSWKTVDFANASMQGLCSGLARLTTLDTARLGIDREELTELATDSIYAIRGLTSRSGGLAEAFPHEDSYCVTGQVLADAIDTISTLRERLSVSETESLTSAVRPLAEFLQRADETHAIISNHLATNALSMVRWYNLTGESWALGRANLWIERIRRYANDEGWFREYGGADPGYQSWAMSSLAQLSKEAPQVDVDDLVERGFRFLAEFAQTDGSFANGCGSRMTSFLFSAGPEIFRNSNENAALLSDFCRQNVSKKLFVSLDSVDEPNLTPFFNDVVFAAAIFEEEKVAGSMKRADADVDFPSAGLYIRRGPNRSSIVSASRGGWFSTSRTNQPNEIVWEPLAKNSKGRFFIAGAAQEISFVGANVVLRLPLKAFRSYSQSPGKFLLLRLFVLSLGRLRSLRELMKWLLARMLILRSGKIEGWVQRTIHLPSGVVVDEVLEGDLLIIPNTTVSPYHMASQGYWRS